MVYAMCKNRGFIEITNQNYKILLNKQELQFLKYIAFQYCRQNFSATFLAIALPNEVKAQNIIEMKKKSSNILQ
jgi:hypothetical protein